MYHKEQLLPVQCFFHKTLIDRPPGIPGYRPKLWCSVCGKSASIDADHKCEIADCPNLCHSQCLSEKVTFNCENTEDLRSASGIHVAVTFYIGDSNANRASEIESTDTEEEEDNLNLLGKEELLSIAKKQRKEITTLKTQLLNYKTIIEDLPKKRSILVEALSIIDTLVATQATIEPVQQRSIASTADPVKIDEALGCQNQQSSSTENSIKVARVLQSREKQEQTRETQDQQFRSSKKHSNQQRQQPRQSKQQQQDWRHQNGYQSYQSRTWNRNSFNRKEYPFNRKEQSQYNSNRPLYNHRDRCYYCNRFGHTSDNCLRQKQCDYCNKRNHTSENCRIRLADHKQQEFLTTLNQRTAETVNSAIARSLQFYHSQGRYQQQSTTSQQRIQNPSIPTTTNIYGQYPAYHQQNGN